MVHVPCCRCGGRRATVELFALPIMWVPGMAWKWSALAATAFSAFLH